jgi:protein-disulfide isomerase
MAQKKEEKPKSNAALLIIGAVLIVAVLGGVYCANSGKNGSANSNGNSNTKAANSKTSSIPANAPPGANPPNAAGSPAASVTIEEYADFQCPQCGMKHTVMNEIKSLYGSRINFVFRNFPLKIPAHDKAYDAAVAAEAAGLQGKFWDMQNLLFQNQQAWTASPSYKQMWKDYAGKIGLDVAKWENDMIGIAAKGRVEADIARGTAVGVNSTPSVYINGVSLPFEQMTVDGMKAVVDAELAKATGAKPAAPASNAAPANNTAK